MGEWWDILSVSVPDANMMSGELQMILSMHVFTQFGWACVDIDIRGKYPDDITISSYSWQFDWVMLCKFILKSPIIKTFLSGNCDMKFRSSWLNNCKFPLGGL